MGIVKLNQFTNINTWKTDIVSWLIDSMGVPPNNRWELYNPEKYLTLDKILVKNKSDEIWVWLVWG